MKYKITEQDIETAAAILLVLSIYGYALIKLL